MHRVAVRFAGCFYSNTFLSSVKGFIERVPGADYRFVKSGKISKMEV